MAHPFNTTGFSGTGLTLSFSKYLQNRGYTNERDILWALPNLDPVQQIKLDMSLNQTAIDGNTFPNYNTELHNDKRWKEKLIDVFNGRENNPQIINSLIQIVKKDIKSHEDRLSHPITGSRAWHETWLKVYYQWLDKLRKII